MSNLICRGCGEKHNKTTWEYSERVFRASLGLKALPSECLIPTGKRTVYLNRFASQTSRKASGKLELSWEDYQYWTHQRSCEIHPKHTLGVANYSANGGRREFDMTRVDRFYFDCDGAGDWSRLERVFKRAGIKAFFHESSSSVARRAHGDHSLPLKWHVEILLTRPLENPLSGLDMKSPEARYARKEWKRRYQHAAAVMSALAGFVGIGAFTGNPKSCGFDATTAQMCQIRFIGASQERDKPGQDDVPAEQRDREISPNPMMSFLQGPNSLDWDYFLMATGYEAGTMVAEGVKTIRVPTPSGVVKQFQVHGATDQLEADIRDRISVRQFMASFCGYPSPHSGTSHYLCPIHYEPTNKRSLHVFNADKLGGQEMWRCFGDCETAGDVNRMGQLFWGCTRWEARNRLATHVGLDPSNYRSKLTPLDEAPKPVEVARPEEPVSKGRKKHVPKQAPPGLQRTGAWAKEYLPRFGGAEDFTRALTKVFVQCKVGATKGKDGELGPAALDVVASTLWPMAGDYYRTYDNLLAAVLETYDRMTKGQRTIGRNRLRERCGSRGMFELAKAMGYDGCNFRESLKALVGFGLTRGDEKEWLDGLWAWFKANPAERSDWDKEKQADEYKKWKNRYTKFLNAIRRPGGCSQCEQTLTGEGGRDLGPTGADGKASKLKRRLVCTTKPCLYCFMLQSIAESELLDELWADRPRKDEEGIYIVEGTGIRSMEHVPSIKAEVTKDPDPKLGIVGWGGDGKPTLTYFVTSREAATVVSSAISVGGLLAYGKEIPVTTRYCKTPEKAIDAALAARISFNLRAKQLIEERDAKGLCDWLWWAAHRTPVKNPRNKDALPWPTKAQIKEQVKAKKGEVYEPDLYPGEVVTYTLSHRESGYFLGRRTKIPWSLDQAMDAMAVNYGFQQTQNSASGGAAKASA
jgi:hypothetical protein